MRLSVIAACFAAAAWATPIVVSPGDEHSIIITQDNTVNATTNVETPAASSNSLNVEIVNNLSSAQLYAYVTGQDVNGKVVLLSTSGEYYYPSASTSTTPVAIPSSANIALPLGGLGSTTTITLPDYLISGRIWIAEGQLSFYTNTDSSGTVSLVEPAAVNPSDPSADIFWGFVEFNYDDDDIYANLSFVDFVGMVIGMSLTLGDGSVQTMEGLQGGSVPSICSAMESQTASDGFAWSSMCYKDSNGNALRILSPNLYMSLYPDALEGYYSTYVDQVWSHYTSNTLTINTQTSAGDVTCTASSSTGVLTCSGDNRSYAKPTVNDIMGCNSGPFLIQSTDNAVHVAVVPRLCAAFVRSTLLLAGGNLQPSLDSDYYYTVSPTNHYARIVHQHELDGKGYAFSYDDVNPDGENQAGVVTGSNPELLRVVVGGWSS